MKEEGRRTGDSRATEQERTRASVQRKQRDGEKQVCRKTNIPNRSAILIAVEHFLEQVKVVQELSRAPGNTGERVCGDFNL